MYRYHKRIANIQNKAAGSDVYECLGEVAKWACSVDDNGTRIGLAAGMKHVEYFNSEQGPYQAECLSVKHAI